MFSLLYRVIILLQIGNPPIVMPSTFPYADYALGGVIGLTGIKKLAERCPVCDGLGGYWEKIIGYDVGKQAWRDCERCNGMGWYIPKKK